MNDNVIHAFLSSAKFPFLKDISGVPYSRFSHGVTAPMLVYRTLAKKCFVEFWEFEPVIMQSLSDILRLSLGLGLGHQNGRVTT